MIKWLIFITLILPLNIQGQFTKKYVGVRYVNEKYTQYVRGAYEIVLNKRGLDSLDQLNNDTIITFVTYKNGNITIVNNSKLLVRGRVISINRSLYGPTIYTLDTGYKIYYWSDQIQISHGVWGISLFVP